MAGDRYNDPDFIGWLTVNLSLIFAKEGLEQFSEDEVKTFCNNIKRSIQSSSAPIVPGPHTCIDNTKSRLHNKKKLTREWEAGTFSCQADHCDQWLGEISKAYIGSAKSVEWDNSDLTQLSTDPWACAKLYMPYGCEKHKCATDADLQALLTLYIKCTHFHSFFNNVDDCKKIKEIRNNTMHSATLKADAPTVTASTQVIIQFLEDLQKLQKPQHQQASKDAVLKIKELLSGKTEISLNREYELRVLNEKLASLVNEVDGLATSIQDLTSTTQDTSTDVASNAEDIDKLKDDHKNLISELALVKSTSEKFSRFLTDNKITGVSTEKLSEVSNKIDRLEAQIQAQLKQLTDRVETLERQLKDMNKEQAELKQEHGQLKRTLREDQAQLKQAQVQLETKIAGVSDEQKQSSKEREELKKEQMGMKKTLDEVSEVQKQYQKIDLSENRVTRIISCKDIQDRLISLYHKRSQKVLIYPLRPEWKQHVASLFIHFTDIQHRLISLYHKHSQKVLIYPLRPEWKQHVASLFVHFTDIQHRLISLYHKHSQKVLIYPLRPEWKQHVASLFIHFTDIQCRLISLYHKHSQKVLIYPLRPEWKQHVASLFVHFTDIQCRLISLYHKHSQKVLIYPLRPEWKQHVASLFIHFTDIQCRLISLYHKHSQKVLIYPLRPEWKQHVVSLFIHFTDIQCRLISLYHKHSQKVLIYPLRPEWKQHVASLFVHFTDIQHRLISLYHKHSQKVLIYPLRPEWKQHVASLFVHFTDIQHRLISLYHKHSQKVLIYPLRPEWKQHVASLFVHFTDIQCRLISLYHKYSQKVLIYPLRPEWKQHVASLFIHFTDIQCRLISLYHKHSQKVLIYPLRPEWKQHVVSLFIHFTDIQCRLISLYHKHSQKVLIYPLRPEWKQHVASLFVHFTDIQHRLISLYHKHSQKVLIYPLRPEWKQHVASLFVHFTDIQHRLISLYHKHSQKVLIYPLRPEWKQHVASLFVLPSMKVTNPRGLSKHHLMFGTDEGSDIKVTSIKDIFPPTDSRCTDIYIMGDAGTGKSTLCEYLVHLWVKCHTSSSESQQSEEKVMERFELLFFISLREAKSCHVEDMVKSQLQLEDVNIARLLYDHSSLIILDGLDEYSLKQHSRTRFSSENLPSIRHSGKCTVLTTSRPWKLELLRRELEDKIQRQILIVGLDTESQKMLVGKVVELLNSETNCDKKSGMFFKEVQSQKLVKFMKTPVLLMQMIGLWFSGEILGGSKCSIYAKLIDKQIQFSEEVRKPAQPLSTQRDAETSGQDLFSMCFKNYTYIMSYRHLLQKVNSLAYRSLSSKDRANSLVFSHEQMELFDMSHEEVKLCLDLGLLTQYKVFGEITQRLKSVSFIHKSHHEYCAAVYLSQIDQADELNQLLYRDFTSLEHILEMGTVFIFVCGMNATVARDISRFIMDKASGDARLEQYRKFSVDWYTTNPNTALVKQLQGLILAGIEEARQNNHKITGMQLQDLYMKFTDDDFPPARVLACTESLDLSHVKSLFIRDKKCAISGDVLQQLLKETSPSLHKLVLWDTVVSVEMIQAVVQQQQGRLQTLGLINDNVDNVDFSHLNQTDLQTILSAPTHSLLLHGIDLTHSQLEFLCHHVSNSCYCEVWLGKLQCSTHSYKGTKCKQRLDLSASKNISRLNLQQLPVQEVTFVPDNLVECVVYHLPEPLFTSIIRCLKRAEKLERLRCGSLRGSTVGELATTLPHLQHLQNIVLFDINLSVQQQVVQAVGQLKKLEVVELYNVTMREEELQELLAALPSSHSVKVLLGHSSRSRPVTITGYNRRTDLVGQIRHNPHIHVYSDEVEVKRNKCIITYFWFYKELGFIWKKAAACSVL